MAAGRARSACAREHRRGERVGAPTGRSASPTPHMRAPSLPTPPRFSHPGCLRQSRARAARRACRAERATGKAGRAGGAGAGAESADGAGLHALDAERGRALPRTACLAPRAPVRLAAARLGERIRAPPPRPTGAVGGLVRRGRVHARCRERPHRVRRGRRPAAGWRGDARWAVRRELRQCRPPTRAPIGRGWVTAAWWSRSPARPTSRRARLAKPRVPRAEGAARRPAEPRSRRARPQDLAGRRMARGGGARQVLFARACPPPPPPRGATSRAPSRAQPPWTSRSTPARKCEQLKKPTTEKSEERQGVSRTHGRVSRTGAN